ncbi:MAG TPA: DUF2961 domain-containing protein, partial [Phycisphaerales bacterium]|nr:DUF2961 domain-containing protein [Phycisphaerales bacterium]
MPICLLSVLLSATQSSTAAEELTYVDLVNRLTDLEHLATLPAPGEKCQQWSSYDRRSKYDGASGKYVDWAANGDGTGVIRKDGDELVFAEMEGPGVIWRIWSALAKEGHVKIYLDGAEEPAVDLPFIGYFNREHEPFTYPALVHMTARGQNCYVPIPYQKSCKILATGDWGRYFHFTYTTYPQGTILPTFKRELSAAESKALERANEILTQCGPSSVRSVPVRASENNALWRHYKQQAVVAPGATATIARLKGRRAITALEVNVDLPDSPEDCNVLRELTLSIFWDGETEPSVWSPLGDFFGTAAGANKYESLPMGVTDQGFYSFWYMPFERSAVVQLTNDGDTERKLTYTITHAPLTKAIETLGRFHAKWHRDAFLPDDPDRRAIDWTMLKTQGRGRFCGVMLHVWNPRGGWWGEGDEKFFVDGEKFPSTFGTGSEDYFGYAWCDPTLFTNCYHNQTISMGNRGHISVNRWHIGDNVPFAESFEAAIEKYYPNSKPTLYAATAYWYQAAGQTDPYEPVAVEERRGYWKPIKIFKVKDALEGERLKILAKTAGNTSLQDMGGYGDKWSGETHLWWTGAKPDDMLDLEVPVRKSGTYRLKVQLTKARDYGIVQLYLDGEKLGQPIDLFNNGVVPTGVLDMGVHELDAGRHTLRIRIVGANEKAVKGYMFGLDYLKLEEVPVGFSLPEDPSYTILDSARDSVRFAEWTLVPFGGRLCSK